MQKLMLVISDILSAITKCEIKYRDDQTSQAESHLSTRRIVACRTIDGDDLGQSPFIHRPPDWQYLWALCRMGRAII